MSNYEQENLEIQRFYGRAIHAAELEDIEIISSVVPGSRLLGVSHNPIDSGIDEG